MPPSPTDSTPAAQRVDRRTTATRERILVAAEELIAARGVEGFQIKDVAEAVGIRPPSVFAHFKGREDIASEVAARIVDQIAVLLGQSIARENEPMAAIRAAVRDFVAHLVAHPAHVRLLLRDLAQAEAGAGFHRLDETIGRIDGQLRPLIDWGRSEGVFRDVATRPLLPMIQGAILTRIAWAGFDAEGQPRIAESLDDLQREAEDLIVAYVRAPDLPGR